MADGQNPYNAMQANMGLFPQMGGPASIPTPSPGDTSMRLMEQATQRISSAQQTMMPLQMFGNQFQQRFQQAQGMQSLSPYQAQALGGPQQVPGGGSYLPSPLMMTPAQSGVFRPQMPTPTMPVPPMYTPPIVPMPFTPQMPQPMFRTPWEQRATGADLQSNRMFSYGMQAPSVIGQAAGIGAGAYAGSQMLGGFGPMGRLAGAIGGGLLASKSGVAETIGDFAQLPFRPAIETRQMGSAVQRMSQDWVVTGSQLHAGGRGLTQQAGIQMAGGIKDLAGNADFREQTGGMFNRQDLMRMTQMSGQAGMMDMAQSVPAIQQQLKQVAMTVKRFMELTNDPDITNVIREMGQLRQFGMSMPQIAQAAENMRMFSKAAGTSIRGIREAGGMPGAAVYQGMGLSAAQGFDYGNYSMAMSRQMVASGGIGERQLAMLGGVQGMAQRNMQAQAAFTAMPMFAAANAQFGSGGWGANEAPGRMGGGGGAFGMVTGAVGNLNAAVRRGGIGALMSFGLQQNEIADEAASKMTPMEQTAQRFRMVQQTMGRMGMKGIDAFGGMSAMMYGSEVGNQMMQQMKSPEFWNSQQQMYRQQLNEMAFTQRQEREARAPGFMGHIGGQIGRTAPGRAVGGALHEAGSILGGVPSKVGGIGTAIGNWWDDRMNVPEGAHRTRFHKGTGMTASQARALGTEDLSGFAKRPQEEDSFFGEIGNLSDFQHAREIMGQDYAGGQNAAIDIFSQPIEWLSPVGIVSAIAGTNVTAAIGKTMAGGAEQINQDSVEQARVIKAARGAQQRNLAIIDRSKRMGGDLEDRTKASNVTNKLMKKGTGGSNVIDAAGMDLANKSKDYWVFSNRIGEKEMIDSYVNKLAEADKISVSEARKKFSTLNDAEKAQILSHVRANAARDPEANKALAGTEETDRGDVYKRIGDATEDMQDRQEESLDTIEMRLGVHYAGPYGDAMGLDEFKDWAKDQSVLDTVIMSAQQGGGIQQLQQAESMYMAGGGTSAGWDKKKMELQKKFAGLDENKQDFLKKMGKRNLTDVREWADKAKSEGISKSIHTEAFYGKFSGFGKGQILEAMGTKGAVDSMRDFVGALSDDTIAEMKKAGGESAKLGRAAERAKKGDKRALRALERHAANVAGAGDVEDKALVKAEGEEAAAAQRSESAAGEMAMVAQDLVPAAKDLRAAAKMLLDKAVIDQQTESSR